MREIFFSTLLRENFFQFIWRKLTFQFTARKFFNFTVVRIFLYFFWNEKWLIENFFYHHFLKILFYIYQNKSSFNFTDRIFFISFTEKNFSSAKLKFQFDLLRENPFLFNWTRISFKFSTRDSFHFVDRENPFLLNPSISS